MDKAMRSRNNRPRAATLERKSESIYSQSVDGSRTSKQPSLRGPAASQRRPRAWTWRSRDSGSFIGFTGKDKTSTDTSLVKGIRKENTYKLEPDRKVQPEKIEKIIREVLEESLRGKIYDANVMGTKARTLSDLIKERVKGLGYTRFKIISYVLISQRHQFDMNVVSRGLWDSDFDGHSSATYENSHLFAVGTVFTVYQE